MLVRASPAKPQISTALRRVEKRERQHVQPQELGGGSALTSEIRALQLNAQPPAAGVQSRDDVWDCQVAQPAYP